MEESLRDLFPDFVEESNDNLARVNEALRGFAALPDADSKEQSVAEMFRAIHTIKGGCALLGLNEMKEFVHSVENALGTYRGKAATLGSDTLTNIQKSVDRIDELLKLEDAKLRGVAPAVITPAAAPEAVTSEPPALAEPPLAEPPAPAAIPSTAAAHMPPPNEVLRVPLNLVSSALNNIWEVFLVRNQLSYLFEQSRAYFKDRLDLQQSWEGLDSALKRHISELEGSLMAMRMTSVKPLFTRMEKAVRAYGSSNTEKAISLRALGETTELDKKVCDMLGDPLIHLIRNAMDHGIETAQERVGAGKPECGTITLSAEITTDRVIVQVSDDGKGIDTDRLVAKAKANGIDVTPYLKNNTPLDLIFIPGFSTAEKVTDVSGRGVGMDVVRHSIHELGGTIDIHTEIGKGTTFSISLPLSLSVIFATLFKIGPEIFAANINPLVEICVVNPEELKTSDSVQYLSFRERFIPVYDIRDYLLGANAFGSARNLLEDDQITLFVMHCRGDLIAVRVGAVLQNAEIVVKPLPPLLPRLTFVQGISILATGQSVFVLSLDRLLEAIRIGRLKPWRTSREDQQEKTARAAA